MSTPALPFCHFKIRAEKPKHSDYPNEINTFGDHLRVKRLDLGLTQKQVAQELRVDESRLRSWESGRRKPGKKGLTIIATLLKEGTMATCRTKMRQWWTICMQPA